MRNPDLRNVLSEKTSRYALVIATAKRAREISEQAEEANEPLTEKAVSTAIEDIIEGKYKIVVGEEAQED